MTTTNRVGRSCKKCEHYDLKARFCNSFTISISSTKNATYCKSYNEVRSNIPKRYKYKHSSRPKKYNKYKTK